MDLTGRPGDASRGTGGASRRRRRNPAPDRRSGAEMWAGGPLPGDHLLAAYLAATGLLAAATLRPTGLLLAAAHAVGLAGVAALARWGTPGPVVAGGAPSASDGSLETQVAAAPAGGTAASLSAGRRWGRGLRIFLPVALTPLLYTELATLNQVASPGYLDATVQAWESALFGGQPSLAAAREWPHVWLSELLHAGYFSYYLVVPGAALAVYREAGEPGLARLTSTVALAFFVCYLCFAVFPVAGPRYEFPRVSGPQAGGPLFALVHGVLEAGSARGTAFPSSHVAAAAAALLAVRRDAARWFRVFLPAVALLTAGTVYGRFHYAVDALAGLAVAAAAYGATPWLVRRLGGRRGA